MIKINEYKLDSSSICLPGTVTTWGAIIGDITKQQDLVDYVAEHGGGGSAAEWGSITGDISDQTDLNEALSQYVTEDEFVETLGGYAQKSWVQEQGYITSSALSGYATESWVSGQISSLASWTTDCLNAIIDKNIPDALEGYATQSWVQQQGYASDSDLTSLASRVTTLETNYGDAITITNNILG